MIGRTWNGSVSVTITCSSVKLVNFEFHFQDFVYKLWQPGNFAVFTFLSTNFFVSWEYLFFLLSATIEHLTLSQNSFHRI